MKLVKIKAAVKSHALYNRGAKPAQWQVQTEDGQVLFDVRGQHAAYGTRQYSLYKPGEAAPVARGLSFQEVRNLTARAITGARLCRRMVGER